MIRYILHFGWRCQKKHVKLNHHTKHKTYPMFQSTVQAVKPHEYLPKSASFWILFTACYSQQPDRIPLKIILVTCIHQLAKSRKSIHHVVQNYPALQRVFYT